MQKKTPAGQVDKQINTAAEKNSSQVTFCLVSNCQVTFCLLIFCLGNSLPRVKLGGIFCLVNGFFADRT